MSAFSADQRLAHQRQQQLQQRLQQRCGQQGEEEAEKSVVRQVWPGKENIRDKTMY